MAERIKRRHKPQLFKSLSQDWNQTSEGSFGEILRVSLPLVASTASHTILTFTDRVFLSWYSPTAIAAAVPASILSFTFACFFLGTGQYVNVLIAQFFGAKQDEDLARSLWQGIYFAIVSAFLIILCIPLGFFIIEHSGHSIAVIAEEKAYFNILMFGGGLIVMSAVLGSFFSGRSRTKIVMNLSVMGAAINIGLNYVLIFGKLGFPRMGIQGAGIATVIASGIVVLAYILLIMLSKDRHQFPVTRLISFNKRIFLKLLRFGTPNGLQFFVDLATFSAFIFLIGLQGDDVLAASNIVLSVSMLAFMPMIGIGQATSILVGQYMGKKKPEIVVTVTYRALKMAVFYGVIIGLIFFFFSEFFLSFFRGDNGNSYDSIEAAAIPLFKILPAFLLCDCFAIIFGSALGGVGDTRFKMWFVIAISVLFFTPGELLILGYWRLPAITGWLFCTFYVFCFGFVLYWRFKQGKWQRIDMTS
ncbi:MAG: MATE family efflux transporter [Deltaproteobacteria bacterium]|jgi:multidrug resistance protein, MATE family|nr:MATE family efflux transporter [Deltaproteobacteria bacterium]MBT6615441.1 MATE family efflux transporter [Deltaproteobacteria bacterium]